MPSTRSKGSKKSAPEAVPETPKVPVTKNGGDEQSDHVQLSTYFDMYKGFIETTADIMKDEVKSIHDRKIIKNRSILENEQRRESVVVAKNIVISFQDVINKAVKDLQSYGSQMVEELQARYNLPDDWALTMSTNVSMAGSEVSGPISGLKRNNLDQIGRLLHDSSNRRGSDDSMNNGDLQGSNGATSETSSTVNADKTNGIDHSLANGDHLESAECNGDESYQTAVDEELSAANVPETSDKANSESDSETESRTTRKAKVPKIDSDSSDEEVSENRRSTRKKAATATPSKSTTKATPSKSASKATPTKTPSKATPAKSSSATTSKSSSVTPSKSSSGTPSKSSTPAKKAGRPISSTPEKSQDSGDDVLFPSDAEDQTEELREGVSASSRKVNETSPNENMDRRRTERTEFETPEKASQGTQKDSVNVASSSKKNDSTNTSTFSLPEPIDNINNSDSDADSDTSVGTQILPSKKKLKVDLSVVKKERKSIDGKKTSLRKTKSLKREPLSSDGEDKSNEDVEMRNEPDKDEDATQLEDETTAVTTAEDFNIELDEMMASTIPRTPAKTASFPEKSSSVPGSSSKEEAGESNKDAKQKDDSNPKVPIKKENIKKEKEKISKEEDKAMRSVLESSSDSEEENNKRKRRKGKTDEKDKKKTGKQKENSSRDNPVPSLPPASPAPSSPPASREPSPAPISSPASRDPSPPPSSPPTRKDDDSNNISKTQMLINSDLKLSSKCVVQVEKLPENVEKSLAEEGYVDLSGFSAMYKRAMKQQAGNGDPSSDDSDTSVSSNDSVAELEKALKRLTKGSIVTTMKHRKKRQEQKKLKKEKAATARNSRSSKGGIDARLSSDSGSDSDVDERRCELGKRNQFPDDDCIVSLTSDDAEDLDPDSDSGIKGKSKKTSSRERSSRQTEGKRKQYIQATISSSDSERENMKDIVGSDSDSDTNRKKKRTKKAITDSSDSDFKSSSKKRRRNVSDGSDNSDVKIASESSNNSSSSDSDFKKVKSSKRRRDSSEESKKRSKKKRKRIVNNDSDGSAKKSDSDIEEIDPEEGGSSQKGRKNIRKIMSKGDISKSTKQAEREEEERRKRVADRQKTFNGIHKVAESDKIERLVLEEDPETGEAIVEVDDEIVKKLKPHQAEGIRFMYNACYESVEMIKQNKVPGGCILAHCMGLGKTLQSITFLHTVLNNKACQTKTALIICPLSTVNNWSAEIIRWTGGPPKMLIHKLYEAKSSAASRKEYLQKWMRKGGVGIIHYDMFRRLADPKGTSKFPSNLKTVIKEALLDPGPDIVICDEGHLLKNCKSILSLAVSNIRTLRRVVLTGTPLQNNLVEYHTMMNFVKPNLLGSLPEFTNRFVNPIKNGQHADSNAHDVKIMKRRAHVLHTKLDACVQRRDYSILAPYLPPKHEYILNIKLSDKQEELYKYYLDSVVDGDPLVRRRNLLKYYAELVKVWSHPIALTMRRNKDSEDETSEDDSLKDFIDDGSSDEDDTSSDGKSSKKKTKRKTRADAAKNPEDGEKEVDLESAIASGGWWNRIFKSKSEMQDPTLSGKLIILKEILKTCEGIGDRVLIFSQFLSSLDIIEEFLDEWDKDSAANVGTDQILTFPMSSGPQLGRWRRNIEYFRIDGQTKVQDRQRDCDKFNKKSTLSKAKLFLISTRAGGLGINLYGANRVIIFDASWNPSQDMQSIFRVYRFGQEKPCYIYRLIAQGTMEEKILRRQITKLSLSSRVVDEHQIERHFKFDDVNEMYRYDEEDPSLKDKVLAVPKDRLLADLLISHREWIRDYEQFDSLLENKPDEGLTNEEKEIAWKEYELESSRNRANISVNDSRIIANEAETSIKVKSRLAANHPNATQEQLEQATACALQVINKIRTLMLEQNKSHVAGVYDDQLNPLKEWLQFAVSPAPEPYPTVPPDVSLLRPIPECFNWPVLPVHQILAQQNFQRYPMQGYARPPIIRRPPAPIRRPPPGLNLAYAQQQMRNIAVAGMDPSRPDFRQFPNPNVPRPAMNRTYSRNPDPLA